MIKTGRGPRPSPPYFRGSADLQEALGFPLRGSCPRSGLMRRSVVRSELSLRFGAPKAPLGDQGELSAKLTERIRTLLFRLHQRRNAVDQRIRSLRICIGAVRFTAPLLRNSSVSLRLTAPFTQRSLWGAQTPCLPSLGEVAERSEGQRGSTPSQSASLTALP